MEKYVSSTGSDLSKECRRVSRTGGGAGHFFVGAESKYRRRVIK